MTTDVDVAILGAGIGGLATAAALRERGVEAHVFERAPALAPVGAALLVRVQSLDLLRRWTGLEHYAAQAVRVDTQEHLRADGTLLTISGIIGEPGDPRWADSVHRADLFETLRRVLPDPQLHLGRETVHVEQDADAATAVFADGSRVRARALIAADGIRSVVRRRLFSDDEAVYSGMVNYRAVVPVAALGGLPADQFRTWADADSTAFLAAPVRGRREVAYDAVVYDDSPGDESWTTWVDLDEVAPHFAHYPTVVHDILAAGPARVSAYSTYDRAPIDTWTDGRVALLGDAAHPMLPFQGQGANQAIQDAEALAAHLAPALGGTGVPAALRAYQAQRKPRTDHFQNKSRLRYLGPDNTATPARTAGTT